MSSPAVWGDSFVLFAVFSAAMAVVLMLWRLRKLSIGRNWVLFFLPALGMTLWGILWWRENSNLQALRRIIDVPRVTQAYAPPNSREMKLLARTIVTTQQPDFFISKQDRGDLARSIEGQGDSDTWVIETPLSPAEVRRFYEANSHHQGWQITQDISVAILLEKADESMLIGFGESRSGKGSTITYFMQPIRNTDKR